jgi:hypothetical protein
MIMTAENVNVMMDLFANGKEVMQSMIIAHVTKKELVEEREELMMSIDINFSKYE